MPAGDEVESNWTEVTATFDDMDLKEDLLRGIYAYGFEKPSAIQQRGIVPVLQGRDTIAQAQSGTGKTATFAIAILQSVDISIVSCQALVLAPTRELAQQIQKVIVALGDYLAAKVHARRWYRRPRGHSHPRGCPYCCRQAVADMIVVVPCASTTSSSASTRLTVFRGSRTRSMMSSSSFEKVQVCCFCLPRSARGHGQFMRSLFVSLSSVASLPLRVWAVLHRCRTRGVEARHPV